jgi:hypothetical protein
MARIIVPQPALEEPVATLQLRRETWQFFSAGFAVSAFNAEARHSLSSTAGFTTLIGRPAAYATI